MDRELQIAELIARKIKGDISSQELEELEKWLNERPENLALYERSIDNKNQLSKLEVYNSFRKEKVRAQLESELFKKKNNTTQATKFIKICSSDLVAHFGFRGHHLFLFQPGNGGNSGNN